MVTSTIAHSRILVKVNTRNIGVVYKTEIILVSSIQK